MRFNSALTSTVALLAAATSAVAAPGSSKRQLSVPGPRNLVMVLTGADHDVKEKHYHASADGNPVMVESNSTFTHIRLSR